MKFGVSQFHIQLQVWGEQSKANRCLPSLWTQSGHVTQGGPIRMNLIFIFWKGSAGMLSLLFEPE